MLHIKVLYQTLPSMILIDITPIPVRMNYLKRNFFFLVVVMMASLCESNPPMSKF